ncbi:unnamed protein product, partial [Symbiodinium sp. KB8]
MFLHAARVVLRPFEEATVFFFAWEGLGWCSILYMSESPLKRLCMSGEPESENPSRGFVFSAALPEPTPTPARGRQGPGGGGLAVPKDQPRGRSWEGTTGRGLAPPKVSRPSASPHAKSASPVSPLQRDQKRQLPANAKAGATSTAKARGTPTPSPGAKPGAKPAVTAQTAEKMLQAAIALKSSRSIRQALAPARAALAQPETVAEANALLEQLVAAESAALKELSSAGRDESRDPSPPWRLLVLDFDRTIAKEHMWGTFKDAPLEQIPVVEESFSNLALFRWLVRAIRKRSGEVAIATFGRKDVAGKAMQFALGEDHGIFITTPADYPDPCQAE